MRTSLAHFLRLSADKQYATVYWEGRAVSQRTLGTDTVKLFDMAGGFYAEVSYDQAQRALRFVRAFALHEQARLLPYVSTGRE